MDPFVVLERAEWIVTCAVSLTIGNGVVVVVTADSRNACRSGRNGPISPILARKDCYKAIQIVSSHQWHIISLLRRTPEDFNHPTHSIQLNHFLSEDQTKPNQPVAVVF